MMLKSLLIILLLGTTGVNSFAIPFISSALDMINMVRDISDIVTGQHDLTNGNLFKKKVDPVLEKVNQLSQQLEELTNTFNIKVDKIMNAVLNDVPRAIQFANLMRKLIGYVTRIDELFEDYQNYIHRFGNMSQYTLEDFSKVATSHKFGDIQDILRQMYHVFIPGQMDMQDESLLDSMTVTLENAESIERCNLMKTKQQQLYGLYESIVITEIKGYIMATYAYGLLAIYYNTSFDNEIERVTSQVIIRCTQYLLSIQDYLGRLDQDIFLCDPLEHINGETYSLLGTLDKEAPNRYNFVGSSAMSLRPQIADIENNMVVTGVKFLEKDRLFHVQIEQGKLLANGNIETNSTSWMAVERFFMDTNTGYDRFFKKSSDMSRLVEGVDYQLIYREQCDVNLDEVYALRVGWVVTGLKFSIDPDNSKAVQLEVHLTSVDLKTGVLSTSNSKWITYKDMPDHNKPFNERKKLNIAKEWPGYYYYDNSPEPQDFSNTWFAYSASNDTHTQKVGPCLDIREAIPQTRGPLEGVSLIHRRRSGSTGFLGFKLKTVDIREFLNTELSQETLDFFKNDLEYDILTNQAVIDKKKKKKKK